MFSARPRRVEEILPTYLMGTRRKCFSVWPPYQLVTACQYPASKNHVSPN